MPSAQRVVGFPVQVYQAQPAKADSALVPATAAFSIARPHHRIMVVEPSRAWFGSVIERLDALCSLDKGWDGYRAGPVAFGTAAFALRMLESICTLDVPPFAIVPGVNGDLQIEWHTNDTEIELHVRAPNDVHAWRVTAATGMDGEEISLTNDFTLVARWIRDLVESVSAAQAAAA